MELCLFRNSFRVFACIFVSVFLLSCKEGSNDFAFFEDPTSGQDSEPDAIEILNFTPTGSPIRITSSSNTTFAVSVNASAGDNITYEWKLNGSSLIIGANPFYELAGSSATAGLNSLEVTASNESSQDSKIFNVQKNQVPSIDSNSPASGGNSVNCGAGTINFSATASDPDLDGLTYTWKLNGAVHATYFSIVNGAGSSSNDFTPPCSITGNNSISLEVSDGYDTTSFSWSVSVVNPSVAQITNYSPLGGLTVIPSTGNQSFSISATGKNPLLYKWQLNGTDIPGETNSFINLNAASVAVGNHTLTAVVNDPDSNDTQDFNIKRNAPPVLTNPVPSNGTKKINYQSFFTFTIDGSDGNSDTISYTWTLNDAPSAFLSASNTVSGSQAIFSPDISLLGSHTIKVTANDGTETTTYSWPLEVNFFSDACNNLEAGKICTVVGAAGMGSGINPSSNPQTAKIRPDYVVNDGNDNYFISDSLMDVVWFYNRSGSDITVLNVTVPAGEVKVVAGTGAPGTGTAGVAATSYRLYDPYGIAWNDTRKELYIASYNAHRVVHVGSDGIARHSICNGNTTNNEANHTEGAPATSHSCNRPAGLAFDKNNDRLYVANYSGANIKYFDISDADSSNWTGHIMVGRKNGSGSFSGGSENGNALGGSGSSYARTNGPWALSLDKDGVLHFSEYGGCRVRAVNTTGSTRTFFGGGRSVANNKVLTLFGTGSCNVNTNTYTTLRVRRPRGLQIYQPGGVFKGWFVSNDDYDRITFVNNTASTITVGNRAVPSNTGHYVWGNGQDGYNGDSLSGKDSLVNYAFGMTFDSTETKLVLADRLNNRLRSLEVNVDDGNLESILFGKEKRDFSGGSNTPSKNSVMNQPTQMAYDATNKLLIFSDAYNGRVRSLNLVTGAENTLVGQGLGNGDQDQEDPQDVYMRGPRGIAVHNGGIVFADKYESNGTNRNCLVRVYNQNATTTNFWNTAVIAGKVATVAGNYTLGCAGFSGAMEGTAATTASVYRPEGVATDGTNLYIAASQNHCILKVDNMGNITTHVGRCGSAGDVNGSPISSTSIRLRYPGSIMVDPQYASDGNLFIADQTDRNAGRIKYVNKSSSSVSIAGITVAANSVATIFNTGGYSWGVASFDNQICYTSGHVNRGDLGSHNVTCKRRDDPLGNISLRVGPADGSSSKGGMQNLTEQEGGNAASASLASPYGLSFDGEGNLYISERESSVIRKVKKWW